MADEDDRIILLNNRGDTFDEVSPNLRNSGGDDLELQTPGYQVKMIGGYLTFSGPVIFGDFELYFQYEHT